MNTNSWCTNLSLAGSDYRYIGLLVEKEGCELQVCDFQAFSSHFIPDIEEEGAPEKVRERNDYDDYEDDEDDSQYPR